MPGRRRRTTAAKPRKSSQASRAGRAISTAAFAELLDCTPRRVRQHVEAGMPHQKAGAALTIVPRDGIRWLLDQARKEAARPTRAGVPNELEERAFKMRAARTMAEIDVAERRRELVTAHEAEAFAERLVGMFSGVAAGQLQQFERDMVTCATPPQARDLRDRMHAALIAGALEAAAQLDAEIDAEAGKRPAAAGAEGA